MFSTFTHGSIILISFFYILPIIINFTKNKILITGDHQNNSKAILAYTLNQKSKDAINNNDTLNLRIDNLTTNNIEEGNNLYYTSDKVAVIVNSSNIETSNYIYNVNNSDIELS